MHLTPIQTNRGFGRAILSPTQQLHTATSIMRHNNRQRRPQPLLRSQRIPQSQSRILIASLKVQPGHLPLVVLPAQRYQDRELRIINGSKRKCRNKRVNIAELTGEFEAVQRVCKLVHQVVVWVDRDGIFAHRISLHNKVGGKEAYQSSDPAQASSASCSKPPQYPT